MSNKTIEINTDFLNVSGKKKKTRKIKEKKQDIIVSTKTLRNKFLDKIKSHQQKNSLNTELISKHIEEPKEEQDIFKKDFDQLNQLVQQKDSIKKEKKKKRKTKKKNQFHSGGNNNINIDWPENNNVKSQTTNVTFLSDNQKTSNTFYNDNQNNNILEKQSQPSIQADPQLQYKKGGSQPIFKDPDYDNLKGGDSQTTFKEPSYGNLKGGSKPTYSEFYKTRKAKIFQKPGKKYKKKIKKTKKRTFTLGKKENKVSVLIKNNFTRRKIKKEHALLKQTPLNEIKKYLLEKNLISIGTSAPTEILRKMYEESILAGNINNVNKHNSLYNFYNNK